MEQLLLHSIKVFPWSYLTSLELTQVTYAPLNDPPNQRMEKQDSMPELMFFHWIDGFYPGLHVGIAQAWILTHTK